MNPVTALKRVVSSDTHPEPIVRDLLDRAGIAVNGHASHDIVVHDPRFYGRVLRDGSLGLGESYMDGWWDSPALDEMIARLLGARLDQAVRESWQTALYLLRARLLNRQRVSRAFEVGERHYDVGNDLYEAMLDRRMLYTCGYWNRAHDLEAAQEAKLELVCQKIGVRPGMKILELGCGWGGFATYAAERHGAEVVGYTVSTEQASLARERAGDCPVDIRLADYRDANGQFDAVISIGLMEHVGYKNYGTYLDVVERCLRPGGVAFVHTIAGNTSTAAIDPWFDKYIFANAQLPSIAQLGAAMEGRFSLEDLHNIGPHYDPTLLAWHENFEEAWPRFADRYGERFRRMWRYYLLSSAGSFRARHTQLYQIVLTRAGTRQPDCRKI